MNQFKDTRLSLFIVAWLWWQTGVTTQAWALVPSTLTDKVNTPFANSENQLIVKFRQDQPYTSALILARDPDIRSGRNLSLSRSFVVRVPRSQEQAVLNRLRMRADIEYAEVDALAYSSSANDTYVADQWNLDAIKAPLAWQVTKGSPGVSIAILDSGIDNDHPDISPKVLAWANFSDSPTQYDQFGHGTHVAGIAGAMTNNQMGVAGVGYQTTLMSVKVLSDQGYGRYSWIAEGIYYAANNGAKVINLSLGGTADSSALREAVSYAVSKGVVVVAAAGNNGSSRATYPAYFPEVLAVAAVDKNMQKPYFSNYGTWVDFAAPGVQVLSTLPNQPSRFGTKIDYGLGTGTSMATPHVSGVAALLAAVHPNWTQQQITNKLKSTAVAIPNTGRFWRSGFIDAAAALDYIGLDANPSPTPTPLVIPTPTPTPTPSPSPTILPSSVPTPMPTVLPTLEPSPSPQTPDNDNPTDFRRQLMRELIDQRICQMLPSRCNQ